MPDTMEDQAHILVVDDDERLRGLLKRYLSENGFIVSTAADSTEARTQLASFAFDLMVLDVMMPGETGTDLTASLREKSDLPILLLTAMGEPEDRISGFESGADDYLTKPFEPRELLLRIRTILRRVGPNGTDDASRPAFIRLGICVFDLVREVLSREGEEVRLSPIETALLSQLAAQNGSPVSRETLIETCGIRGGERTVDVQVTRLRRKIEPDSRIPRYILTVRGQGYRLRVD